MVCALSGLVVFDSLDPRLSFTGRLHADGGLISRGFPYETALAPVVVKLVLALSNLWIPSSD